MVSFLTRRPVISAAIITGEHSPLMMRRTMCSISSWNTSRCSTVRCRASWGVMGMVCVSRGFSGERTVPAGSSDSASLRPKPTNSAPAPRCSQCMPRCTRPTRRAVQPAASAHATLTKIALKLNSTPSRKKARALSSVPGAMNCGTKARKNSATLGFRALVQKPPRNTLLALAGAASFQRRCGLGSAREQHPHADPEQVGRANPLEDGEGSVGGGHQGAQAQRPRQRCGRSSPP